MIFYFEARARIELATFGLWAQLATAATSRDNKLVARDRLNNLFSFDSLKIIKETSHIVGDDGF